MTEALYRSGLCLVLAGRTTAVHAATADDADLVWRVFEAATRPDFAAMGLPETMVEMLVEQQFRARESGYAQTFPNAENWIIKLDGVGVGRLLTEMQGEVLHLIDLALLPQAQRRGIGGDVLRGAIAAARIAGSTRVILSVFATNPRAEKLYRRLGFVLAVDDAEAEPLLHRMHMDLT